MNDGFQILPLLKEAKGFGLYGSEREAMRALMLAYAPPEALAGRTPAEKIAADLDTVYLFHEMRAQAEGTAFPPGIEEERQMLFERQVDNRDLRELLLKVATLRLLRRFNADFRERPSYREGCSLYNFDRFIEAVRSHPNAGEIVSRVKKGAGACWALEAQMKGLADTPGKKSFDIKKILAAAEYLGLGETLLRQLKKTHTAGRMAGATTAGEAVAQDLLMDLLLECNGRIMDGAIPRDSMLGDMAMELAEEVARHPKAAKIFAEAKTRASNGWALDIN